MAWLTLPGIKPHTVERGKVLIVSHLRGGFVRFPLYGKSWGTGAFALRDSCKEECVSPDGGTVVVRGLSSAAWKSLLQGKSLARGQASDLTLKFSIPDREPEAANYDGLQAAGNRGDELR